MATVVAFLVHVTQNTLAQIIQTKELNPETCGRVWLCVFVYSGVTAIWCRLSSAFHE